MKIGIFAKTFKGTAPQEVLKAVSQTGYDVAQYNMACSGLPAMPDTLPENTVSEIRAAAATCKVKLVALSATFNMIHPDRTQRQVGLKRLAVLANAASELDIPLLTLCSGTRDAEDQWRHHPDNASEAAWADLCESMAQAITIAEASGMQLGIEPELANVVNSATAAKRLIDQLQSPLVKVVLDPANLFEQTELRKQHQIVSSAVGMLASHIVLCHAKDRSADGRFVAAGTGVLDYDHFLKTVMSAGITGPLITHGLTPGEAPQVARFLRTKLAEIA